MAKKNTNLSNFESDLKKLQDILDDIESDKLSLEESIENIKRVWSYLKMSEST